MQSGSKAFHKNELKLDMEDAVADYNGFDHPAVRIGDRAARRAAPQHIAECLICCTVGPVIRLMKNCKHEAACRQCLRTMYVKNATTVDQYPLKCFYPDCKRLVRDSHLLDHGLVESEAEMTRFYRLSVLAKGHKRVGARTVDCPFCEYPLFVPSEQEIVSQQRLRQCRNCHKSFKPDVSAAACEIMSAIDPRLPSTTDRNAKWFDPSYGLAQCPFCKFIISKNGGCDHMHCAACDESFSWAAAQAKSSWDP